MLSGTPKIETFWWIWLPIESKIVLRLLGSPLPNKIGLIDIRVVIWQSLDWSTMVRQVETIPFAGTRFQFVL